ncbi:MAG: MMPL family transporter, partial [Candidatus Thiodiazotropha sp. 6PLUC5]
MSKIILSAARHPAWVIAALCCITILALTRLPNLNVEIAAEGMMIDNPPALVDYQRTMETFGSENVTIIYLEDPNLFEAENLSAISQVLKRIEKIPQVTRTVSLFSVRYLRTVDGYIHTDPYLSSIPETRQDAALLIEAALLNPLIERNLLSASGSVMAINLFFDMENYHRGFDEQVALALDQAIEPLQKRFRKAFHLGDPSIRSAISEQIRSDQLLILPLALVVLITTLAITLGNWKAPLIPLLTAGMSIIWILGLMAALGIPVNVMTSIVPVLLIIVGSTEDIHLLSEYQAALRKGKSNQLALSLMAKYMGMAILLTFATTALGFLSISLNRIDLLQQFGLISALGLAINFLITITLVPA